MGKYERAKEAYKRGHAYRRAIDLTRRVFPGEVAALEEEWGDWLVSQHQVLVHPFQTVLLNLNKH